MKITRTSYLTGRTHVMDIPVSQEQVDLWEQGVLIQDVMPDLSSDQREFMISGSTPEEWEEYFG